ncbi:MULTISPECIES: aspartate-semialdehyde dehydrogenase [unclassified Burkholderia]|uniref:aspartate-semialdehyde dehydrogenase n=1 Tax=unclassified Burkholderia TaxID=2613784 RepID=UPI0014207D2F|nr:MULTISPECIES: aspartate-semialdehyde dehydrogenase [unclassified Burkholderia]NIE56299.1 aspartate-semialdehyde dehydrogenase [Burkholderia sp. Ap-955]NIF08304.1 aspartate-semialdehyde dehydrogenase [Burkholderia sp. Ax-1735]NIG00958.1 aspartate-semialdehyde dehydrogenase [Burkholderia sp. Tr-849]
MKEYRDPAAVADALLDHCKRYDYAGYDPFDGLNSRLFRYAGLSCVPLASIAWLQFHKRSPINLRGLVGVPRMRNPKGIALMVLGLLEREKRIGDEQSLVEACELGDWLLDQRVDRARWQHSAWGYHFAWAARAFFVPVGTPNAITTCYAARALHALGEATGEARFVDAAVDAGYFLDSLYMPYEGAGYYAYIPGETAFVHNASLWVAALVAEAARRTGSASMRERALNAAELSVSMQRDDGAWAYGLRSHHGFVDGFHTGYNLEALRLLQRSANTHCFSDAIGRGLEYYRNTFFLADGTVKYYDTNVWPIDMHSVAQALITLLTVSGTQDDRTLARRVYARAMQTLYLPEERRFAYQKTARFVNRVDYLRWTQAWAFYSIGLLANSQPDGFEPHAPSSL